MTRTRTIGFISAALIAGGAVTAICFGDALHSVPVEAQALGGGIDPPPIDATTTPVAVLEGAKSWLGARPTVAPALRGKVVIVNFWTFSCVNSLRALPYLRAWHDRYASKGLLVIGVHAPEFGFEKDPANVRAALAALGVTYPNLQDNEYAVWRRFANQGWPSLFFIDAGGHIRGYHLGEGGYEAGETYIRRLLTDAGQNLSAVPRASVDASGLQAQADWGDLRSPESYLGYDKAGNFESPGGLRSDRAFAYAQADTALPFNHWDLSGSWTVGHEFATLAKSGGAVRFRFHARDAHFVLGTQSGQPIRFRVTLEGAAPGADHGVDVDAAGWGTLKEDRLYQLVRQRGDIQSHTLRIEFAAPGVRAYVFTFG